MAALIFILVWHFGKPIFVKRGITEKQRFFTAAFWGGCRSCYLRNHRNFYVGSHLNDQITVPWKQSHGCEDGT